MTAAAKIQHKQWNVSLDLCKAISALGVVLVHFKLPGIVGEVAASMGTAGVILFFLLSGYASHMENNAAKQVLLKRFAKNLKLLLITLLSYFVISCLRHGIAGDFGEWITKFVDPAVWGTAVFLGGFDLISGDALWFMVALLYCYLIFYLLAKHDLFRIAYKCLPFLILLRIGMETYTNSFGANWHLSGNAIVGGLPMMLLGHYVAHHENRIKQQNVKQLGLMAIGSLLLMFVTVNVKVFVLDVSQIFKISTGALLFMLCIMKPDVDKPKCLITVGRQYSSMIYLSHFMVGLLIKDVMIGLNIASPVIAWTQPFIAIAGSILFAVLVNRLKQKT